MHSESLTPCMLGNISCFCCRLPTFKKFFREHYQIVKRIHLDPDQVRELVDLVGSDLGPNCLQRLSAYYKRERIITVNVPVYDTVKKTRFLVTPLEKLNYFHNKPHTLTFNISAHT